MKKTSLCYLEYNNQYLMLYRNKKPQDINAGKWIGVGGKFEEGETLSQCVKREVLEETGFIIDNYKHRGTIYFYQESDNVNKNGKREIIDEEVMYLCTANVVSPYFTECSEGTLEWIPKDKVMQLNLWEGDKIFLEKLIHGESEINIGLYYVGDKLTKIEYN